MAKKGKPMPVTASEKKPVRLDLDSEVHDRLEKHARRYGLSKASYVRMLLFKALDAEEREGGGK